MTFTNLEKRWIEITFYLFCKSIFNKAQKIEAIEDFIYGFRWTNMFDYDKIIKVIREENILFSSYFIPKSRELIIVMTNPDNHFRLEKHVVCKLAKLIHINYSASARYQIKLSEEINKTEIFPKLQTKSIHKELYGFLKAIKQFNVLTEKMKI